MGWKSIHSVRIYSGEKGEWLTYFNVIGCCTELKLGHFVLLSSIVLCACVNLEDPVLPIPLKYSSVAIT